MIHQQTLLYSSTKVKIRIVQLLKQIFLYMPKEKQPFSQHPVLCT